MMPRCTGRISGLLAAEHVAQGFGERDPRHLPPPPVTLMEMQRLAQVARSLGNGIAQQQRVGDAHGHSGRRQRMTRHRCVADQDNPSAGQAIRDHLLNDRARAALRRDAVVHGAPQFRRQHRGQLEAVSQIRTTVRIIGNVEHDPDAVAVDGIGEHGRPPAEKDKSVIALREMGLGDPITEQGRDPSLLDSNAGQPPDRRRRSVGSHQKPGPILRDDLAFRDLNDHVAFVLIDADDARIVDDSHSRQHPGGLHQALADQSMVQRKPRRAMRRRSVIRKPDAFLVGPGRNAESIDRHGRLAHQPVQHAQLGEACNSWRVQQFAGQPAVVVETGFDDQHVVAELLQRDCRHRTGHPAAANHDVGIDRPHRQSPRPSRSRPRGCSNDCCSPEDGTSQNPSGQNVPPLTL